MSVKDPHADYQRMVDRWTRCREAAAGQDAVHAAAERYLPKLKDQNPHDYASYVMRATFYNATWRTLAGLVGMVFRKPPVVTLPEQLRPLLEDVTLSGVPFHLFAQEVMLEALKCGRLGVLVDYPQADVSKLTQKDAETLNLRPTMQLYMTEACINWRCERVNNVWKLTMLILRENHDVVVDEFTTKSVVRYRVLDIVGGKYRVRMFEVQTDRDVQIGGDVYPLKGSKPLDFIPFVFIGADACTAEVTEPPLIDLVDLNLSHYRTTADYEHGAHFTGLPTPYVCGAQQANPDDKLYIGSTHAWVFKDPQAQVGFLEFTGQGLTALKEMLESKETRMAVLGARMLEQQKRGVESADSVSIHRKGEESMLSAASQVVSLGLTQALRWFVDWGGATPDTDTAVELNKDFYPTPMTPQMLTALTTAWQQGGISFQTFFENLQTAEIIDEELTPEEEQSRIGDTPPALQGQNVDPVTGEPATPNKLTKQPKPKIKAKSTTITTPKGDQYKIEHN